MADIENFRIKRSANELKADSEITSDGALAIKMIQNHEEDYSKILSAYADNLESTLKWKARFKFVTFCLSCGLLIAVSLWLFFTLKNSMASKNTIEAVFDWKEWIISIGPVVISFLTVFMVIPKVITEYLFNSEEEKYMSEIIKNIQDYDKRK